jgi:phosphoribosylanthranilate isomerase
MHRTRIKICGIMRPEDARAAVEAGADAIGMILHANAPRRISRDTARAIVDAVPDETDVVGVFVDAEPTLICEMVAELQLDQVQLHGHESPDVMQLLGGLAVIKVLRDSEINAWRDARALLLESTRGACAGGTGIESDWDALAPTISSIDRSRLVLAGGLNADNVAKVIRRFRPWTVDVSSGVEQTRGIKSIEKMRRFCAAVREVDADDPV